MPTAVNIRAIPVNMGILRTSLNNNIPISTAVTGSIAPSMAAYVEPMFFIEYTNKKLESTVAIRARLERFAHNPISVTKTSSPETNDNIPNITVLIKRSQNVKVREDKCRARVLFTPTIYDAHAIPDAKTIKNPAMEFVPGVKDLSPPMTPRKYIPIIATNIAIKVDIFIFSL